MRLRACYFAKFGHMYVPRDLEIFTDEGILRWMLLLTTDSFIFSLYQQLVQLFMMQLQIVFVALCTSLRYLPNDTTIDTTWCFSISL